MDDSGADAEHRHRGDPLRYSAIAASDALDKVLYEINLVEDGRRVDADD